MVEPRGCIELGCRYLYSYVDRLTGNQYVGCMQEVFAAEVDLLAVLEPGGFGGVKMTGVPLDRCRSSVERAYDGQGDAFECVNPGFFEKPEAADFDLRDRL